MIYFISWISLVIILLPSLASSGIADVDSDSSIIERSPEKIYLGCLTEKKCLSPEDHGRETELNCIEAGSCDHVFALGADASTGVGSIHNSEEITLELYSKSQWLALGLEKADAKIQGNEYVLAFLYSAPIIKESGQNKPSPLDKTGTPEPIILNYWNKSKDFNPDVTGESGKIIDLSNIVMIKTIVRHRPFAMYCKLRIKKLFKKTDNGSGVTHTLRLREKLKLMSAWGEAVFNASDFSGYKVADKGQWKVLSKGLVPATFFHPNPDQSLWLKLHGVCMIVAWVLLVSLGNFTEVTFSTSGVFKRCNPWIFIQTAISWLALVPMGLGFYFRLNGQKGWVDSWARGDFHRLGGYSASLLYALSLLSGIVVKAIRAKKVKSKKLIRRVSFIHKSIVHGTYILGMVMIASSMELHHSELACYFGYIALVWLIFYAASVIVIAFHGVFENLISHEEMRAPNPDMIAEALNTDRRRTKKGSSEPVKGSSYKQNAFTLFTVAAFSMSLSLVCMVLWPVSPPCFADESMEYFERMIEELQST